MRSTLLLTVVFLTTSLFALWGNGFITVPLLLASLVLGVVCIWRGFYLLLPIKKPVDRKRIFIAAVPLAAAVFMFFRVDERLVNLFRSPIVFSGTCEHTVTFVHLVLREDGSCAYEPGSFLDQNWQSGSWSRTGDTINISIDQSETDGSLNMRMLIATAGLTQLTSDSTHAHGFSGATDRIRVPSASR